ncbi:MAG: imidazolonepropionase [Myxococcales bacterium]|nr:imidazolonepropionase [Myxococcales bacterium]
MQLLISPIGQLATLAGVVAKDGIGIGWDDLGMIENGALLIENGRILYAGPAADAPEPAKKVWRLDAGDLVAQPGFVDPHTHPCWVGSRHMEFTMRAEGATYQEINRAGGGIRSSMRQCRLASEDELAIATLRRLGRMQAYGVTALEAKSGYGLDTESELRQLRAIRRAGAATHQLVRATFLGAHAIPPEFEGDSEGYTDLIVKEMLPRVAAEKLADFCDVFVEDGYFSPAQGRRILKKAAKLGLGLRLHADEFVSLGGAELAADLGAASADHLMAVSRAGIAALAKAGVTATLLPATTVFLGQTNFAPARQLLDAGVRVALSTDHNPGSSHTENLQLVLTLACTYLKMTIPEALAGVTYNAARSLLIHEETGALLPGRRADVTLFNVPDLRAVPYHLAVSDLCYIVVNGNLYEAPPALALPVAEK